MKVDGWDALGAFGAALVGAGVWARSGWPLAAIFWGVLLMLLYVVREVRHR